MHYTKRIEVMTAILAKLKSEIPAQDFSKLEKSLKELRKYSDIAQLIAKDSHHDILVDTEKRKEGYQIEQNKLIEFKKNEKMMIQNVAKWLNDICGQDFFNDCKNNLLDKMQKIQNAHKEKTTNFSDSLNKIQKTRIVSEKPSTASTNLESILERALPDQPKLLQQKNEFENSKNLEELLTALFKDKPLEYLDENDIDKQLSKNFMDSITTALSAKLMNKLLKS